jgi:hypothetical protein
MGLAIGAVAVVSALGIYGCAEVPEFPPPQPFSYNGNAWQVADARGEGRMQIMAVDPKLAGMGTIADQRHMVANMPPSEYRAAATGWFATSGRFCTPDQGTPVEGGGVIYTYTCWHPL